MRRTIGGVAVLLCFMLLADMSLVPAFFHCYSGVKESRKIFVDLPWQAGQMTPFIVDPSMLRKVFPDMINPRVPTVQDIGDMTDQYHFMAGGFGFVLFGDFNDDGLLDVALVGKYDNTGAGGAQFFFAILSIDYKSVALQYFENLGFQRILLRRIPKFLRGKYDAISRVHALETERCNYVFWDGTGYLTEACNEEW